MPKCYICRNSVPGADLKMLEGVTHLIPSRAPLSCSSCRNSQPTNVVKAMEVAMSEKKAVASIQIFPEEGDNFSIEGFARLGGVKIEIDTDMNRVRDFFTKRKVKRVEGAAHLKAVKE